MFETLADGRQFSPVDCRFDRNSQLMALSRIAQLDQQRLDQRPSSGRWRHDRARLFAHLADPRVGERRVAVKHGRPVASDHFERHRRAQKADRRADASTRRYHDAPDAQLLRQPPGMKRCTAAKRHHRVIGYDFAAFDRVYACCIGHVFFNNFRNAGGRPKRVHGQRSADAVLQRLRRQCRIELDVATGKAVRVDTAELHIRIGDCGLGAAVRITRWPRLRTGGVRTHGDARQTVDTPDRATTGADLDQFDDRNAHRQAAAFQVAIDAADFEAPRTFGLSVIDQANLRGGATHIEGQHIVQAAFTGDVCSQDCAAGRPGLDQPDRKFCGVF